MYDPVSRRTVFSLSAAFKIKQMTHEGKVAITEYIFHVLNTKQFDSKNLLVNGWKHSLTTIKTFQVSEII